MPIIQSYSKSFNLRSLVCDDNGIIIAETVYRCMFCGNIFDSLDLIQQHYHQDHYEDPNPIREELLFNNNNNINEIDYDNDDFDDSGDMNYEMAFNGDNSSENFDLSSISLPSNSTQINTKGGSVTCEVCGLTKFYSHISRRYGVFSCESCAKFFYRYSQKPVQYTCLSGGNCSLKVNSPGTRCKYCLLNACLKKYILDPKKHSKIIDKHFSGNNDKEIPMETSILLKNDGMISNNIPNHLDLMESKDKLKKNFKSEQVSLKKSGPIDSKLSKYRRMACRKCKGCLADDCGTCQYCLDKPKFGGNDVKKQKCLKRKCLIIN